MAADPPAAEGREFTAFYYPGPSFVAGAELVAKPEFRAQVAWWRARESAGEMRMVGELLLTANDPAIGVAVVWNAADEQAARQLAEAAPLVRSGVFRVMLGPGAPQP